MWEQIIVVKRGFCPKQNTTAALNEPRPSRVGASPSGPAGSLLKRENQLNTHAEPIHCSFIEVKRYEEEEERDQRPRVTHHRIISAPQ